MRLRFAETADIPQLEHWDRQPRVIAAGGDDDACHHVVLCCAAGQRDLD